MSFFLFSFSYANEYRDVQEVSLKKDEQQNILVKYDSKEKNFTLRWTLFKNGGLILFNSYDKVVGQHILYLNYTNQSFRVRLKPSSKGYFNNPYLLVRFKEFNHDTNEAKLELHLSDGAGTISLEYLKND